jgi:hypothetical protein
MIETIGVYACVALTFILVIITAIRREIITERRLRVSKDVSDRVENIMTIKKMIMNGEMTRGMFRFIARKDGVLMVLEDDFFGEVGE